MLRGIGRASPSWILGLHTAWKVSRYSTLAEGCTTPLGKRALEGSVLLATLLGRVSRFAVDRPLLMYDTRGKFFGSFVTPSSASGAVGGDLRKNELSP